MVGEDSGVVGVEDGKLCLDQLLREAGVEDIERSEFARPVVPDPEGVGGGVAVNGSFEGVGHYDSVGGKDELASLAVHNARQAPDGPYDDGAVPAARDGGVGDVVEDIDSGRVAGGHEEVGGRGGGGGEWGKEIGRAVEVVVGVVVGWGEGEGGGRGGRGRGVGGVGGRVGVGGGKEGTGGALSYR